MGELRKSLWVTSSAAAKGNQSEGLCGTRGVYRRKALLVLCLSNHCTDNVKGEKQPKKLIHKDFGIG